MTANSVTATVGGFDPAPQGHRPLARHLMTVPYNLRRGSEKSVSNTSVRAVVRPGSTIWIAPADYHGGTDGLTVVVDEVPEDLGKLEWVEVSVRSPGDKPSASRRLLVRSDALRSPRSPSTSTELPKRGEDFFRGIASYPPPQRRTQGPVAERLTRIPRHPGRQRGHPASTSSQ
ncbi:hypothetical protein ACIG87_30840 [Micromonospora sp. NPDC051925]|uniref:hypothetical protein n=1 Tax=Micromonospora sp. NPDC051925 TaxID=3364288 RepID=UPI0037C4F3AF